MVLRPPVLVLLGFPNEVLMGTHEVGAFLPRANHTRSFLVVLGSRLFPRQTPLSRSLVLTAQQDRVRSGYPAASVSRAGEGWE